MGLRLLLRRYRRSHWLARTALLVGFIACGHPEDAERSSSADDLNPEPKATAPPFEEAPSLSLDQAHTLDAWQGGQRRILGMDLVAGEYISGTVTQAGIDVELEIRDPDGNVLLWVDTPVSGSGVETFHAIADRDGRHTLEIHAFGRGELEGTVSAQLKEHRAASEMDHLRVHATRLASEAERMRQKLRRQSELVEPALETYGRAAEQWRQAQSPAEVGRMLMEMGAIRWRYGGEIEAADRLLAEAQPLLAEHDASYRARLRHYRGELAVAAGRPAQARDHYAAAVELWPAVQGVNLAGTLNNLGFIEHRLGLPQGAIESYGRALELWRQRGIEAQEARTAHNLAKVYLWIGDYDRARSLLHRAASIREQLDASTDLASTWAALGQLDAAENRLDAAEAWFEKAADLHRRSGEEKLEAYALVDLAVVARRAQRLDQAERLLRRSLPMLERNGARRQSGRVLVTLARLHLARGQSSEAARLAASAREILESSEDPMDLAGVYALTAQTLNADGKAEQALSFVRRAVDAVERIRKRPTDRLHRASFLSRVINVFETAIEVELARGGERRTARALAWAERSKGRSFLDELVEGEADFDRPYFDPGLALDANLEAVGPASTEDGVLLLYFLGDRGSYLWKWSAQGIRMWPLPPARELEAGARRLYRLFSGRPRLELAPRLKQAQLHWSRVLLPEDLLLETVTRAPDAPPPHLRIVADGALHYLPFGALLGAVENDIEGDIERRPLIERFDVSYAPSLTILRHLENRRRDRQLTAEESTSKPQELLVVADPVYEIDPRCPSTTPDQGPGKPYRRLAGSAEEAAWLKAHVPGARVLSGFEARADHLRALDLKRFRRIHFAVHGELGTGAGKRPRLVLAQRDRRCEPSPSSLEIGDIFQWRLRSELVVLGACKSGLGRDLRGEGLIGMTRAFLQAGSSQVVVSLWDMDDRTASRWTTYFYEALAAGASGPSALRRAQLRLRQESGDDGVFYWAPFVLFGAS